MRRVRLLGVGLLTSATLIAGLTPTQAVTPRYSGSFATWEECDDAYQNNPRAAEPCSTYPGPMWRYSYWP